ncbi:hypothetical protein BJV40_002462 [Clostridium beijerinckii]|nr:hypothetical protein [Clostridium beijerinckii]
MEEPLYKAMREDKILCVTVAEGIYDVPFKAISYPIKDSSGKVF